MQRNQHSRSQWFRRHLASIVVDAIRDWRSGHSVAQIIVRVYSPGGSDDDGKYMPQELAMRRVIASILLVSLAFIAYVAWGWLMRPGHTCTNTEHFYCDAALWDSTTPPASIIDHVVNPALHTKSMLVDASRTQPNSTFDTICASMIQVQLGLFSTFRAGSVGRWTSPGTIDDIQSVGVDEWSRWKPEQCIGAVIIDVRSGEPLHICLRTHEKTWIASSSIRHFRQPVILKPEERKVAAQSVPLADKSPWCPPLTTPVSRIEDRLTTITIQDGNELIQKHDAYCIQHFYHVRDGIKHCIA